MKALTAICWVSGLCIAGSESQFFPWNVWMGAAIFSLSLVFAKRIKG